jgi:hypothetical protein
MALIDDEDSAVAVHRPWRLQIGLGALFALMLGVGIGLAVNQVYRADTKRLPNPSSIRLGDTLTVEISPYRIAAPEIASRRVIVLADGTITLPHIGQVPAAGLSLDALRNELRLRYLKLWKNYGVREVNVFVAFAETSIVTPRDGAKPK